jgi:hypothetical protein
MILMAVCGLVATLAMVPTANAWMGSMYRNREALRPSDYDEMPFYRPGNPMPRTGMWYQQRRSALNLPEVIFTKLPNLVQIFFLLACHQEKMKYSSKIPRSGKHQIFFKNLRGQFYNFFNFSRSKRKKLKKLWKSKMNQSLSFSFIGSLGTCLNICKSTKSATRLA